MRLLGDAAIQTMTWARPRLERRDFHFLPFTLTPKHEYGTGELPARSEIARVVLEILRRRGAIILTHDALVDTPTRASPPSGRSRLAAEPDTYIDAALAKIAGRLEVLTAFA
ncbi:hypothetical protein [Paraburkholderia flagellata]|uniref:hypothetical protein n=1 Tax=Paraburkholderia flagellata TaxID=2883241 RepID=UPI0035711638